ncbi:Supervillin [Papilio xuthus]|uniref:Supervillin n=1 Tax=Papilio xuthus TaxID=66420 RepID=A0A194PV89_PAPXU|nr:Supervillin [Papilio xuthus]
MKKSAANCRTEKLHLKIPIQESGVIGDESPGAEKTGSAVRIPKADDESFQAFFAPLQQTAAPDAADLDLDLDAIDSASRQLLSSECARRAKRERRRAASRNPLRALAARTDLRQEYLAQPCTLRDQLIKEKATANCGLAAEALAALASKEDFSSVALRSAAASTPSHGTKPLMLLHVKGRRRVQTRLVEPVHRNVNRGDCFLLVTPDQVFLYIGLYANVIERNRSTDIALHIFNTKDLGCKNSTGVIKIDEQTKNYSNKQWNQFWSLLGVSEDLESYRPAEAGHADEDEIYESCIVQTNMCYEVIDDELVPIKEYWGQLPRIAMLNLSKIIVFDFGSEMYIWYGKNVPLESRRRAAQLAQELFNDGYNYEECHVNPLNAAVYQGLRDDSSPLVKSSQSRPEWAILSKVTQHMETILFKEKFLDWPDYTRVIKVKPQENKSNGVEITPCDAEEMWSNEYQEPDLVLEGSHLGRGTHYYDKESMRHYDIKTKSVCKWLIQEYDYQKVDNDAEIGEFFSADSYIIRWEYQITVTGRELNGKPSKHNLTGRDRCAYFCWQGRDASSNEKGAAALLTVELDKERGPQVRVAQGAEPPAFLNLFQGNLIIHQGKRGTDKSRYKLFVTRGNVANEAYLLQVPCSVRQLRSRGSLLLVDTEKGGLYIWHGSRSLKHTKSVAIELANKLIARNSNYLFGENVSDVKITEVKEGEEPREVLEALGGANKQYYSSVLAGGAPADVTMRLFHFTDLGGQFEANEVLSPLRHEHLVTPFPFEQKELYSASQPALFLVDDGQAVWLWQGWWPRGEDGELEPAEINAGVGAFAARWQALRLAALRTAQAYAACAGRGSAGGGRGEDVRVVAAGLEPAAFEHLFDTWHEHDQAADANIAALYVYGTVTGHCTLQHGYKAGEARSGRCEVSRLASCDALLPLPELQRRPLPDHVDPHHLERHLASPDFIEAFGMTKEEFAALPAWKQTNMKKDVAAFLLLCCAAALGGASALSIKLRQNPETLCLGQDNFLRIASVDNCYDYYQCYAGRSYLMQCPEETWFNEEDQVCDRSELPANCRSEGEPEPELESEPETDPEQEIEPEEEVEEEPEQAEEVEEEPEQQEEEEEAPEQEEVEEEPEQEDEVEEEPEQEEEVQENSETEIVQDILPEEDLDSENEPEVSLPEDIVESGESQEEDVEREEEDVDAEEENENEEEEQESEELEEENGGVEGDEEVDESDEDIEEVEEVEDGDEEVEGDVDEEEEGDEIEDGEVEDQETNDDESNEQVDEDFDATQDDPLMKFVKAYREYKLQEELDSDEEEEIEEPLRNHPHPPQPHHNLYPYGQYPVKQQEIEDVENEEELNEQEEEQRELSMRFRRSLLRQNEEEDDDQNEDLFEEEADNQEEENFRQNEDEEDAQDDDDDDEDDNQDDEEVSKRLRRSLKRQNEDDEDVQDEDEDDDVEDQDEEEVSKRLRRSLKRQNEGEEDAQDEDDDVEDQDDEEISKRLRRSLKRQNEFQGIIIIIIIISSLHVPTEGLGAYPKLRVIRP